ncbi:MAG: hypothetical protein ACTHMY_01970 [Solirubrobacteraceae bacterium]
MATSHDQVKDSSAELESAAGDLEIPEAVAERTVGGDGPPPTAIYKKIPGTLKWNDVQLK